MKKILILTLFIFGCVAETLPEEMPTTLTKDEARAQSLTEEGKADHRRLDICQIFGWYDDNECDEFCPNPDPDCEAECQSDSDCAPIFCVRAPCPVNVCNQSSLECQVEFPDEPFCPRARCAAGFICDEESDSCVPDPAFCGGALCGPSFVCEDDRCVPDPDKFCERARCASGTVCDEDTDSCIPDPDAFCPRALCAPGTICDEETDSCLPDPDTFCQRTFCSPGTMCDEDTDSCIPDPDNYCARALCGAGTFCDEDTDSCLPNTCQPDDAVGVGVCRRILGYKWNGKSCEVLSGCSCEGADCRSLPRNSSECEAEHRDCVPDCRTLGCGDGSYCSLCWTKFQCIPDGAIC